MFFPGIISNANSGYQATIPAGKKTLIWTHEKKGKLVEALLYHGQIEVSDEVAQKAADHIGMSS